MKNLMKMISEIKKSDCRIVRQIMLVMLFCLTSFVVYGAPEKLDREDPRQYAKRARAYEDAGTWEAAKREIDNGLKFYPNDPELRYLNGRYFYYAQGDLMQSRYNLIKAIQENDQHYQAKRLLVDVEDDSKHYSSAVCYINELLEFEPYDKSLWRRKISLYNKMGHRTEADQALERLARIYPNDSIIKRDYVNRTRENWSQRIQKSSLADAAQELESWLELDANNLDYYIELVTIYYKLGQVERAIGTANRALAIFPNNEFMVQKAASLMAEMGNYTRALTFLKEHHSTGTFYTNMMREVAADARWHDAYEANARLYDQTKDRDALLYLLNTALVRNYYTDAIDWLREAERRNALPKADLLIKEYALEKRFHNDKRCLALLEQLTKVMPRNTEIIDDYVDMILTLAGHDIETEQWPEAIEHIDLALKYIDSNSSKWPTLIAQKITIYGRMNKLAEARELLFRAIQEKPEYRDRFVAAYEEFAAARLKQLIENEEYERALGEAQELMEIDPDSEAALRTCISMSQLLRRDDLFYRYALMGYQKYPDSPYFIIKEALALQMQGKASEALTLLRPDRYDDEYVNPMLSTAFVGVSSDIAGSLLKDHEPKLAMETIDTALQFDPVNKELLHMKGMAYEQLKEYGLAWEYQTKYYNPSNAEQMDWYQHMRYLKWRSFKNHVDASFSSAFFDSRNDAEGTSAIARLYSLATLSYTRLEKRDTYMGQISYKGTDGSQDIEFNTGGVGLEFLAQWDHVFTNRWSGMASASFGTKYFNKIGLNVGASYDFLNGWVPSLKIGYRLTDPLYVLKSKDEDGIKYSKRRYNLFILSPSFIKSWERVNVQGALDIFALSRGIFYNLTAKSKIFITNDNITSIGVMAGFGSFPELNFFDQSAISSITKTNAMVGFDGMFLLTNNFALSVAGNWNTYYYPQLVVGEGFRDFYRNIFSFNIALHVAF